MMTEWEPDAAVVQFVERLHRLDAGERARLKRNAGNRLAEGRAVTGLFYRIIPPGIPIYQEETYFLVATLFPIADGGGKGDLGRALRQARDTSGKKGLDRRVDILLDADASQLPFRLRQTVHFLQSNRVKIDWVTLLSDLLYWGSESRSVQQRWARSYYND